jgi:hypothetical protein
MYWYKSRTTFILFLLLAVGCKPDAKNDKGELKYFDLKKYFNEEAVRISKKYPTITKTVSYNGQEETKTIAIKHWEQELNSFIESDINKPAWKDSYIITRYNGGLIYQTVDTTLHTQRIEVFFKKNKVTEIKVNAFTANMLYNTTEYLDYCPDSLYYIQKSQAVKILGKNNYEITGKFR